MMIKRSLLYSTLVLGYTVFPNTAHALTRAESAGEFVLFALGLLVVIGMIPLVLLDMAFRLIEKRKLWHPAIGIIISIPLIIAAAILWVAAIFEGEFTYILAALFTTGTAIIFLFSSRFRRIENISFWHPAIISILWVPVTFAALCFLLSIVNLFSDDLDLFIILLPTSYALLIAYLTQHIYKKSLAIEQRNYGKTGSERN